MGRGSLQDRRQRASRRAGGLSRHVHKYAEILPG